MTACDCFHRSATQESGCGGPLDAPWLSKLGGLGTLIWIAPILFGVLRALTTLDALTIAVIVLGVVGLIVQALRHRATRPRPGSIQVGEPSLTRVVNRGPVRVTPAGEPPSAQRPAFITGLNVKGGRIADNVAAGDVDFIRDSELDETEVEGNIHATDGDPPPLPDNPLPTDLKSEARALVKKERERRDAIVGGSPLDPELIDDLRYEYSNLREIAAFGASAAPAQHKDVAADARSWRLRVEKRLRKAHFEPAVKFVFTSHGAHEPLPAGQPSPLVRALIQDLAGASKAQRETQALIGERL